MHVLGDEDMGTIVASGRIRGSQAEGCGPGWLSATDVPPCYLVCMCTMGQVSVEYNCYRASDDHIELWGPLSQCGF